jgi:hypothetical protein
VSNFRIRVNHCGEGKAAIQETKYNGVSTYCFRCGKSEWEPREPQLRPPPEEPRQDRGPPPDLGEALPSHVVAWLAQMGFGRYECAQVLKCYWNSRSERLVFPLHNGFWTARDMALKQFPYTSAQPKRLKWISALRGREQCVQEYGPAHYMAWGDLPVVLTEDLLSAAKIGLSEAPVVAIPCLGTLPSPAVMARAAEAPTVVWWLDPDAAGQRMARLGNNRLLAVGVNSRIMFTHALDQDPKLLDPDTITRRLSSVISM